ncbi:uncharacterized protein LOC106463721 isoform X2 [Limulus polyphemus]|uniref:Uncharacterized protein LOC106463721 isoform X2 n=1 Tax=Limulus polyphemus TaxID=6850 RepID=A0ABM1STQ5_LIMPO|nr:uncharacterized protein LOC106463721 isoform X2 [Limulus polyphemus]
MFSGYTEVVAYGRDLLASDSLESDQDEEFESAKLRGKGDYSFGGGDTFPVEREDFIVIAECSEVCGPLPLITIPENGGDGVDLNEFVVRILSADYEGLGSSGAVPPGDASLLIPDAMRDVHTLVKYFVLMDSRARGFVRPMCMAYVTSDKFKLLTNAPDIEEVLQKTSKILKHSNRKQFLRELENLMEDLDHSKNSVRSDLQQTKQHIKPLLEKTEYLEEKLEEFLDFLHHLPYQTTNCYFRATLETARNQASELEPRSLNTQLSRKFCDNLRPLTSLSPSGSFFGLYLLFVLWKFFRRKQEHVSLNRKNEFPGPFLHFGAVLKEKDTTSIQSTCGSHDKACRYRKTIRWSDLQNLDLDGKIDFTFIDSGYFNLFFQFKERRKVARTMSWAGSRESSEMNGTASAELHQNRSFPSISVSPEFHPGAFAFEETAREFIENDELEREMDVTDAEPELEETSKIQNFEETVESVGITLDEIWDEIDRLGEDGTEFKFFQVLAKISHIPQLLFSVLIGQLIVVMGNPSTETLVRATVMSLGLFSPQGIGKKSYVEPWRTTPLSLDDVFGMAVIGLCISDDCVDIFVPAQVEAQATLVDLNNWTFSGPQYSGVLLQDLEKKIRSLPENGPVFSVITSSLLDVERKVQLWHSIRNSSAGGKEKREIVEHLLGKNYSACDFHILQRLGNLLLPV